MPLTYIRGDTRHIKNIHTFGLWQLKTLVQANIKQGKLPKALKTNNENMFETH